MKFTKIRQKILVYVLPVIALAMIVLILVAYFESKEIIEKESKGLLEASGAYCASNIDAWETETLAVLNTAVMTITTQEMDQNAILSYEEQFLGTYEAFPNGIYIAQSNRNLIDASGWEPEEDITKTEWYLEGVEHPDEMLFGEPYVDRFTGESVVTASRHTDILGIDATIAADVNLSTISSEVASVNVTADGDSFVIDAGSGIILAGQDESIVTQNAYELEDPYYATVCDAIKAGNTETATYNSYMTSINPISKTDWYIVTRAFENNVFRDIRKIGIILTGIGILALIAVVVIVAVVIGRVTRPINDLNNVIKDVTDGDFTTEIQVKGADEIAQMALKMKDYISAMRDILAEIIDSAHTIDVQSESSQEVSNELNDSANEQVVAMDTLLGNLRGLVDSVALIAENATSLAETVMDITNASNEALETMDATKSDAENGKASMIDVDESMKHVKAGMEKLEVSISDVGSAADKIEEITSTIKNIASQTNLLALNASIEAARAGEAGRGFGVVAEEIKNLATTSGNAANEISELIASVMSLISITVDESRENAQRIADSSDLIDQASVQFNSIYSGVEKTNTLVQNIISEIIQASDVATNMAAITEEQAASAQEIEGNAMNIKILAEKVQENGEAVRNQAELLSGASEVLRDNMSKFKI